MPITGFGPYYYDRAFAGSEDYQSDYHLSPYFSLYMLVMEHLSEDLGIRILELGAGTGQFGKMLKDHGYIHYTGVEFSQVAVKIAQDNFGVKLIWQDIFTWTDWDCDLILAMEVFEHTDDLALIRNMPKGKKLLFTVPNFAYESHLRWFGSLPDVAAWYGDVLDLQSIEKAMVNFYIVKGITR